MLLGWSNLTLVKLNYIPGKVVIKICLILNGTADKGPRIFGCKRVEQNKPDKMGVVFLVKIKVM